jgi:hypothetical protein
MAAPALRLLPDPAMDAPDVLAPALRVWDVATHALIDDLGLGPGARILQIGVLPGDALPESGAYDVVHARFQLARHGRDRLERLRGLVAPGGVLVLEEPDTRTMVYDPYAPAAAHLLGRVAQVVRAGGGDLDAGRRLEPLLRRAGLEPRVRTHVLGLEAGHPALGLPLDLAEAYGQRLADVLGRDGLADLRRQAAAELAGADRRGTTLTLVQAWARV